MGTSSPISSQDPPSPPNTQAKPPPPKHSKAPNPLWKYLGFGADFRPKIPSRNWLIFLSITSTFAGFIIHDKRETKRAQRKWCKLVEHMSKEPLHPKQMPRKLMVVLETPPCDGLKVAQEHFKAYVKPVLVASGLDWEFVQGRREGDVRAAVAESIRERRRPDGEKKNDDWATKTRKAQEVEEWHGMGGHIVVGRHAWKEYIRGLHEGWMGPLDEPPRESKDLEQPQSGQPGLETSSQEPLKDDAIPKPTPEDKTAPDTTTTQPAQLPPYISTSSYASNSAPPELPTLLDPSAPIPFPHILGFINTPLRLYRFLNRRHLADTIGRETAAVVLCCYRPYHNAHDLFNETPSYSKPSNATDAHGVQGSEIQTTLQEEEREWPKSVWDLGDDRDEGKEKAVERVWLDPIVLDDRIAGAMRRAQLAPEDEKRAQEIKVPEIEIEGWIKGGLRHVGKTAWANLWGGGKKKPKDLSGGNEELV